LRRRIRPAVHISSSPTTTPTDAALGTAVERLVWAHRHGYGTAKARRTTMDTDRPLKPSEAAALVEAATKIALDIR
jgi:hypothetical protein